MGRWRSTEMDGGDGCRVGMDSMLLNCNFKMIEMVNFMLCLFYYTHKRIKNPFEDLSMSFTGSYSTTSLCSSIARQENLRVISLGIQG